MRFIHISDLHIRSTRENEHTVNAKTLVRRIIERYTENDKPWVIITGDVVDDGGKNQYIRAKEILSELIDNGFKLLVQPGNHDYGIRGNFYQETAQARFQRYILGALLDDEYARSDGVEMEQIYPRLIPQSPGESEVVFIELDSIQYVEDRKGHFARGAIGPDQRNKMMDMVNEARAEGKKIVVCVHHHPFYRQGEFGRSVMAMYHADEFMDAIRGKVDVLCFGHKHKSSSWSHNSDPGGHSANNQIPLILASGKSNDLTDDGQFRFREVSMGGDGISMREIFVPG